MTRKTSWRLLGCTAALLLSGRCVLACQAGGAAADISLGAGASIGPEAWHGLKLSHGFVLEPEAYATVGYRRVAASAGIWAAWERTTTASSAEWAERNLWIQLAATHRGLRTSAGVTRYTYSSRRLAADQRLRNATELFLTLALPRVIAAPELEIASAHERGTYIETRSTLPILATPLTHRLVFLYAGATLGVALSPRRANIDGPGTPEGSTHGELSVGARAAMGERTAGGFSIALHGQVALDSASKAFGLDRGSPRRTRFWVTAGAALRWRVTGR
jgi:hypothetical protein